MTTIPQVARAMREILTTTADEAAHATRFVQRTSPLGRCHVHPDFGVWLSRPSTGLLGGTDPNSGDFGRRDQPPSARSTLGRNVQRYTKFHRVC
jgi:hypothetical protein